MIKRCIFIFDEGPALGLDDTTLTAEARYPINFTQTSLHYNGRNSLLFVNATVIYQLRAKDSEIKLWNILCLGNISKDFTINNMKKIDKKIKKIIIKNINRYKFFFWF